MISREELSLHDVVRLRCGSPRFIVSDILVEAKGVRVEISTWHDRHGFVSRYVPIEWLCWPKTQEEWEAEKATRRGERY